MQPWRGRGGLAGTPQDSSLEAWGLPPPGAVTSVRCSCCGFTVWLPSWEQSAFVMLHWIKIHSLCSKRLQQFGCYFECVACFLLHFLH